MQPAFRLNRLHRLDKAHTIMSFYMQQSRHSELLSICYITSLFVWLSHCLGSAYIRLTASEGYTPNHEDGEPDFDQWHPSASVVGTGSLAIKYFHGLFFGLGHMAGVSRHVFPNHAASSPRQSIQTALQTFPLPSSSCIERLLVLPERVGESEAAGYCWAWDLPGPPLWPRPRATWLHAAKERRQKTRGKKNKKNNNYRSISRTNNF